MTRTKLAVIAAMLVMFAAAVLTPVRAFADTQSNKNTWRNLAIGSGAVGVYGLATHNSTLGLLGAAGAGYSAYRYEQDRHHQSQARDAAIARARYYHRHYRGYWKNGHYYRY